MQDRIGSREDAFRSEMACGRTKERQQLGCPSTLVFVWLQNRVAFWLPRCSGLWNRLIGSSFIFIQLDNPSRLCLLAGQFYQLFFSGVCSSYTVTVTLLRLRSA
jgi:hypothetical protein